MCPSTEATDGQIAFAAYVLQKLLRHIAKNNNEGRYTFLVSDAWTGGPMMYLVYKAPPSDIIWGLVRDTRESIIDPGPWPDLDAAVKYYYLLDLEGIQPSEFSCHPGEPGTIFGWAIHAKVRQIARQTSPRRIGIRHPQDRPRQSATKIKISS
jgi:hypothetical protein